MNQDNLLTQRIVPFYLGEQRDSQGRMIQEIWAWDVEDLECTHDYIQWLFPLAESSAYNPDAPLVDRTVIEAFKRDSRLQGNLVRSLTAMLRFYGLERQETESGMVEVIPASDYEDRIQEWVQRFDHNYLRITRILKCLMMFGLEQEALAFYDRLRQIYREKRDCIGGETFQYWADAIALSS